MIHSTKTIRTFFSVWIALTLIATMVFSAPLWSADKPETVEVPVQEAPENDKQPNQPAAEAEIPSDFKPSEEISEDFPVPLPSDI